jgi:hypothetical protein
MYTYYDDYEDSQQETYTPITQSGGSIYGECYGMQNWSNEFYYVMSDDTASCGTSDLFSPCQAEDCCKMSGIEVYGEDSSRVGDVQNGDWIMFGDVDFGSGALGFDACVASAGAGGEIMLRLDDPSGIMIGSCQVNSTNSNTNWVIESGNVNGVSGVHDLYLVFTGGSGDLFEIDWFEFFKDSKQDQVITFPEIPVKTVGDADFDPKASSDTGLSIRYWSSDTSVVIIVNDYIHIVGAGNATITASVTGDSIYNSTYDTQIVVVNQTNTKVSDLMGKSVRLYPNPFSNRLAVQVSGFNETQLSVFNTVGEIVKRFSVEEGESVVDLSDLSEGIYIVQVRNESVVTNKRVVKCNSFSMNI